MAAINLPFLFFGYKHIGKNFCMSSIFAIVALAIIEFPLHPIPGVVDEPM